MINHKKEFIKLFNSTAHNLNRFEVFSDFVKMSAIAIYNAIAKNEELEKEYLEIVGKYKKEDVDNIVKLFSHVVMGLEAEFCDFLGDVFMESELGSNRMGQFFTPYHLSKICSDLTYSDDIKKSKDKEFITVHEPACGAGGMVIAFANTMLDNDINYQQKLFVSCIDKDYVAAYMCFIQLSLLNIPAEVIIGNALNMDIQKVFRTPAYYLGNWEYKLNAPQKQKIKTKIILEYNP